MGTRNAECLPDVTFLSLLKDSNMIEKRSLRSSLAAAALAATFAGSAWAQTPPPAAAPAPEPDWTFTGNVGLYSQYVFRGIAQTNEKPALQGGFDLGHKSGFYAGTWASNISWLSDGNPDVSASPRMGLLRRLQAVASRRTSSPTSGSSTTGTRAPTPRDTAPSPTRPSSTPRSPGRCCRRSTATR